MNLATTDSHGTERAGAQIAATLRPGDIVLLSGDLGAGKTTFVRGAAEALGVTDPVTSPTFAIGHRYRVSEPGGPAGLSAVTHLDLYRLKDLSSEDPDLLTDYLTPDAVSFIEWAGAAEATIAALGRIRYHVRIGHGGMDRRDIHVTEG